MLVEGRTSGVEAFVASISEITGFERAVFDRLIEWAEQLALMPNVSLYSNVGTTRTMLKPHIASEDAGLITIVNQGREPVIWLWSSVFERMAPSSMERLESAIDPKPLRHGTTLRDFPCEVIEAITAAYQEAVRD